MKSVIATHSTTVNRRPGYPSDSCAIFQFFNKSTRIHSRPQSSTVFFLIASRVALVMEKNLNFLIGRLKMNAQQDTTSSPSTHNFFLPVEFQMLTPVYLSTCGNMTTTPTISTFQRNQYVA